MKKTNTTKTKLTFHAGANKERTAWLAKLRRARKSTSAKFPELAAMLDALIAWGKKRNERCGAKAGGL